MDEIKSVFQVLSEIDLTDKHKEKNGMKYLPWAQAWGAVKRVYPLATHKILRDAAGRNYFNDGKTAWVETEVTIDGLTQSEQLPVMDFRNKSITMENLTSMDVNKAIKRCLVKNLALFGADLNLWNNEEVSDAVKEARKKRKEEDADKTPDDPLATARAKIAVLAKKMINDGIDRETIYAEISKNNEGRKNPNSIKDIETCNKIFETLKTMQKEKGKE